MLRLIAIDHVQLAMPPGEEESARRFFVGVLGLREVAKPANLQKRGGAWFANEAQTIRIHLGVDQEFRPAKKAHAALQVENLPAFAERVRAAGFGVVEDEPLEGYNRVYVYDPFGNRIELLEPE